MECDEIKPLKNDEIESLENIVIKKLSKFGNDHPNITAFIAVSSAIAALSAFMYYQDPIYIKKKPAKSYGVIEQQVPYDIKQTTSNYKDIYG